MYDVKGKWALITGAARGIGYLTAKFMAAQGGSPYYAEGSMPSLS